MEQETTRSDPELLGAMAEQAEQGAMEEQVEQAEQGAMVEQSEQSHGGTSETETGSIEKLAAASVTVREQAENS